MALCRGPVHVPKTQAVPLGGMGIGGQHQQSTAKQQLLGELKMNLLKSRHVLGIGQRNIQGIAEKLGLSVSPIENKSDTKKERGSVHLQGLLPRMTSATGFSF